VRMLLLASAHLPEVCHSGSFLSTFYLGSSFIKSVGFHDYVIYNTLNNFLVSSTLF